MIMLASRCCSTPALLRAKHGVTNFSSAPVITRHLKRCAPVQAAADGGPTKTAVPEVYTTTSDAEITAFQEHQKTALRPSPAEEARTMMELAKFGLLATVSVAPETKGLPSSSVVEFVADEAGRPVFSFSTLSQHCSDFQQNGTASLTVMAPGFKGLSDARFTLQGSVRAVTEDDIPAIREAYLKKYPNAFYVDFGDFRWFVMDQPKLGRYNGGYAMAAKVKPDAYMAAAPDPVAAFSAPVCGHMNGDHLGDMKAMIKGSVGMTVEDAKMLSLDRLGINFEVKHKGESFKLRLPFPQPAEDRKGIKEQIVAMTRAAAAVAEK